MSITNPKPNGNKKKVVDAVVFHSYPPLIYAWPIILIGYLMAGAHALNPELYGQLSQPLGWIYIAIFALIGQTVSVDLNRNQTIFSLILVGLIAVGIFYLRDAKGWLVFGQIANWIASRDVSMSSDVVLMISIIMSIPYLLMLLLARINSRYRITHNEIEHSRMVDAEDALGRGAKNAKAQYPDMLELVLGLGAGTLKIYSSTGRTLLRTIENVPFLWFRMKTISRLLEQTAVTPGADADAEEEEDSEL